MVKNNSHLIPVFPYLKGWSNILRHGHPHAETQFPALDFKTLHVYGARVGDAGIYVFLVETSEVYLLTLYLIGICLVLPLAYSS